MGTDTSSTTLIITSHHKLVTTRTAYFESICRQGQNHGGSHSIHPDLPIKVSYSPDPPPAPETGLPDIDKITKVMRVLRIDLLCYASTQQIREVLKSNKYEPEASSALSSYTSGPMEDYETVFKFSGLLDHWRKDEKMSFAMNLWSIQVRVTKYEHFDYILSAGFDHNGHQPQSWTQLKNPTVFIAKIAYVNYEKKDDNHHVKDKVDPTAPPPVTGYEVVESLKSFWSSSNINVFSSSKDKQDKQETPMPF